MAVAHIDTQIASGGGSSITVTKPTGLVEDDGLAGYCCIDSNETINTISGWTSQASIDINAGGGRLSVQTKVAGASEPADYTFDGWAGEANVAGISGYSGIDPAALVNASGTNTGTSTTPTAPDITTTTDGCMLVAFCGTDGGIPFPFTPPSGYTERSDQQTADADFHVAGSHADKLQASAGATGTAAFTGDTSKPWGAVQIALAPAAAASANIPAAVHHLKQMAS